MLAPRVRLNGLVLACVVAACALEASSVRVTRSALADEDSLLQVRLDIEEGEASREQPPVCKKSLLTDSCSGYRYRSALVEYRHELRRHEEVLKALRKHSAKADYVEHVAPHISALLQDLAVARARLSEALETFESNTTVVIGGQVAGKPSAAGVAPVKLMADGPGIFVVPRSDTDLLSDEADNATHDEELAPPVAAPHHTRRKGHGWIVLVFVCLVVVLFCLMMVVVSVLSIEDQQVDGKAQDKTGPSIFGGVTKPSKFIQVALPYWLPTSPNSRGFLWIFLFATLVSMMAALMFWVCSIFMVVSHAIWPSLVKHGATSWMRSTGLRSASLVAVIVGPAIFYCFRKKLEGRWEQWFLLGARIFVLLMVNMWNVTSTYIERATQDALYFKDIDTFWVTVRLLFAGYALVAGFHMVAQYLNGILVFRWRTHLTRHIFLQYMEQRQYYALESTYRVVDNPDQRIQEDAWQVAAQSVMLGFGLFHSVISMLSFALVLWNLTPMLTFSCMGYSIIGTIITLYMTWQMVKMSYFSHRAEADFRFSLVHVRNNSEAIAFYRGEEREKGISLERFDSALGILYRRLNWEVLSNGFSLFYGTASHIVPAIVISRMYFFGTLDFGAFGQANSAFFATLDSLSFVVNDRAVVCGLATAVNRVGLLHEALHRPKDEVAGIACLSDERVGVKIKDLTATVPCTSQMIVRSLSLSAGRGGKHGHEAQVRILLAGRSGVGKSSLLRVIAGLWTSGKGEVVRPPDEECMFLPQRPYMPMGDLRTQLLYPTDSSSSKIGDEASDDELRALLEHVGLETLPERFEGGFDAVCDWARVLSLGEQQRVAAIRCFLRKPKLTVLDEATSALSIADENTLYERFKKLNLSYISVGHRTSLIPYHDDVLELKGNGEWQYLSAEEYRSRSSKEHSSM